MRGQALGMRGQRIRCQPRRLFSARTARAPTSWSTSARPAKSSVPRAVPAFAWRANLARRIAEQEAALAALRRQLDVRLTDLNRRREELRAELRNVETEIEAVAQGGQPDGKPVTPQAETQESPASAATKLAAGSAPSLSELLVTLVRAAEGKPVTFVELKNQAVQRGFPTGSTNLRKMVENRTYALVKRGI